MSYITISSQEKHNFSLCSCFHALPTTLLLKILGGTNAWPVPPTSNFGGDRPPPGLRPWFYPSPDSVWHLRKRICEQGRDQGHSPERTLVFFRLGWGAFIESG